jgi:hypothetical protein
MKKNQSLEIWAAQNLNSKSLDNFLMQERINLRHKIVLDIIGSLRSDLTKKIAKMCKKVNGAIDAYAGRLSVFRRLTSTPEPVQSSLRNDNGGIISPINDSKTILFRRESEKDTSASLVFDSVAKEDIISPKDIIESAYSTHDLIKDGIITSDKINIQGSYNAYLSASQRKSRLKVFMAREMAR